LLQLSLQSFDIFLAAVDSIDITPDLIFDILFGNREFRHFIIDQSKKKRLTYGDTAANRSASQPDLFQNFCHFSPKELSNASTRLSKVLSASSPSTVMVIREFFFAASIKILRMLFALMVSLRHVNETSLLQFCKSLTIIVAGRVCSP